MTTTETAAAKPGAAPRPWGLWRRQIAAILRLEARKSFLGRRALLLYLLSSVPIAAALLFNLVVLFAGLPNTRIGATAEGFAKLYDGLFLRTIIYFGCAWVFINLFRGEMLDKSLHYYLLSPVRRPVLVAGKFLSGLLASIALFGGSTAASYLGFCLAHGGDEFRKYLFSGPGLGHLVGYLGVTALACVGYGSIFLLLGLFLKNPILPAALIFFWEWLNFLLPPVLKKLSVIHHLKSLAPKQVGGRLFEWSADPTSPWLAIGGLLVVSAAMLLLSGWRIRRMEIDYGED